MNQKASDELAALAAAEGFYLTPIFDPRLFTPHDHRGGWGAKVFLDGREMHHVRRAFVGRDGWVDSYVEIDGRMLVSDDALVIERYPGLVKIVAADGRIFE